MERFYDEQYVRLRNRELDKYYLHADDDGVGVSISQRRNSLNVAWRVHIYGPANSPQLLLHSAAYGRYLAATATPAPALYHGFRAELRDYDQPVKPSITWMAVRKGLGGGVLLQNGGDSYLRANGKYLRWNTGVTVENRDIENEKASTMTRWFVEPMALTERAPRIPDPIRARLPEDLSVIVLRRQPGALRVIRFVRASPDGAYPEAEQGWSTLDIRGMSLYYLRDRLAREVNVNQQPEGIAMCVRAGRYGRLTPLVVDLPRRGWGDIFQIVVFISGTAEVNKLQPERIAMCVRAGRYGRPTPLIVDLPRRGWGDIFQISVFISGTAEKIGNHGSGEMLQKLEESNDCESKLSEAGSEKSIRRQLSANASVVEESQAGSPQSVPREMWKNPSGSTGQSLTEHPNVFIEVARANLLVAESRCLSIRKEMNQAKDRLVHLQQQDVGALPKEERKAVIKEMRKFKEKMIKLEEAAALANEEFAKEKDNVTRAELRHGV